MTAEVALAAASQLADDVLLPSAMHVDATDRVPAGHLDALAASGLYGLAGPSSAGGMDADQATFCGVIEIMASGCLATTFVWLQHHSTVRALAGSDNAALRDAWLEPLCRGTQRAGIALGGARPGTPLLRASAVQGGYVFAGSAPWVTGWTMIDVLHAVARDDEGNVISALLPARTSSALTARRLSLVAVNASRTVELSFAGYFVPAESVISIVPHAQWLDRDAAGLRPNGSLSLGVAARCCQMLAAIGPAGAAGNAPAVPGAGNSAAGSALARQLVSVREALDAAHTAELPAARAAAAELAFRTAGALVVAAGSKSITTDAHPQRLAREALFLLVFGSRPAIKDGLTRLLSA